MSLKLFIKICGITTEEDAAFCAWAGADAVGVNLWPGSRRYLEWQRARRVLAALPLGVQKVGVMVNASPEEVMRARGELGLDWVQLHGDERPEKFGAREAPFIIRAIRVAGPESMPEADLWQAAMFLYDASVDGYGGAGVQAPWDVIARACRRPCLLAGGLSPSTVADAICAVRPDGVDVASGVEMRPGIKDPVKIRSFIGAARAAAASL